MPLASPSRHDKSKRLMGLNLRCTVKKMRFEEVDTYKNLHKMMTIKEKHFSNPKYDNPENPRSPRHDWNKIIIKTKAFQFQENYLELIPSPDKSMSRLGTIREELKMSTNISIEKVRDVRKKKLVEDNESYDTSGEMKARDVDPALKFTRKRSNSMFASFQNLIKKDEDNIRLLLPLVNDQDLNLPIADAVLELQLEYMDKFHKKSMKQFMRRKS
jgi:hypothetical protein